MPTLAAGLYLAVPVLAGWLGSVLGVPLAWLIGPMVATAALAVSGRGVFAPVPARRFGQLVVGAAIGLGLDWTTVSAALAWLPLMLATALLSVVLTAAVSVAFARVARIDLATAYFAMLPGGVAEMASIGERAGAQNEPIALTQSIRLALVVLVVPPLIAGLDATAIAVAPLREMADLATLATALALGAVGAAIVACSGLNNPWMVGSLLAVATATAFGLTDGRMPDGLLHFGQFLLGISIGRRFRREIVSKLRRLALAGLVGITAVTALLLLYAVALSSAVGFDYPTAALATAPGGIAEMAVTAKVLNLDIAFITVFHVVRTICINGFALYYLQILSRIGFFRGAEALLERVFPRPTR